MPDFSWNKIFCQALLKLIVRGLMLMKRCFCIFVVSQEINKKTWYITYTVQITFTAYHNFVKNYIFIY